jgi:Lon protease-like protein
MGEKVLYNFSSMALSHFAPLAKHEMPGMRKVMFELPLFPLNTVLFPGMPLPLHIFEDRYKQMIRNCLEQERPFGVVLIREGIAESGPLAEPYEVGCIAQITHIQPLEEGRMLIMSVGSERFRIHNLKRDKPYLIGQVEPMSLVKESADKLEKAADKLYPFVLDYLKILAKVGQVEFDADQIPTDPQPLAYLAAALVQIEPERKQAFLENNQLSKLSSELHTIYRDELKLLRWMPTPNPEYGLFSLN